MSELIELKDWQEAKPNTCGSCKFIKRSGAVGGDRCTFKLPSYVVVRVSDADYEGPPQTVNDEDRCDFYQSTGATYAKRIQWKT